MKSRFRILLAAITFFAGLALLFAALALPLRLAAQEQKKELPRYSVIDLGTLGGSFGEGQGINNRGWVTGTAYLPGNTGKHRFLWQRGVKTDLGTLGGPNSGSFGSGGLNDRGQNVGQAETSSPDPLGEDFCGFGTHLICLPFLWQTGVMTPLPTFGGNNGNAQAINNQAWVVGKAENTTLDSTCSSPELQAEPAIWRNGTIQQLPTFPGDPDGLATAINGSGLVVGGSGDCPTGNTNSLHALLWQNGTVTNLGSLGGTLYNIALDINDKGQVTGGSDLPGDTNFFAGPLSTSHAFLWQHGVIRDLGTLPGDAQSYGLGINNKGQVVGGFASRAYIWQNGVMTDLNTLVPGPPFSPLYLLAAESINDRGEIAGLGLAITGEEHAFLAIPCDEDNANVEGCRAQAGLKTYTGQFPDGATYLIEVPPDWNGNLFLYSHGYTLPGTPNPAVDTGDLLIRLYLLSHKCAMAGSSYANTGWAIQDALRDQLAVLNKFDSLVGHPSRTIAWGHSLGGIISAGLVQNHPDRFSGAVCLCGVLAGSVGAWNEWLDSAFAFNTLLASGSGLKIVDITDPIANLGIAETVLSNAQATPQGQARIALAAALVDSSGWIDPFSPQPNPEDYATLEANQFLSLQGFPFALFFALRAELEGRAEGNPSWNTGVDYATQLRLSVNYAEVQALYKLAGLSLDADIQALNRAARIAADPAAVGYLSRNIIFNGGIEVPVLTVHTTGDDIVNVQNEQAYAAVVHEAHNDSFLRETFVHRAGHCNFTPAETIAALQALIRRLDTGEWQGVDPAHLNATASRLPPVYNFLFPGASVPSPAAFIDYTSAPFQRPFDAFDQRRGSNNSAVTVSSGLSAAGGGVYNTGTLTILNDTLSGNTAEGNFFHEGSGGGIFNDASSRTLPPSLLRRMSRYRFPGRAFGPKD